MTATQEFMDRVIVRPRTRCWHWTGSRKEAGYGRTRRGGRDVLAHRVSYELHVGPIPSDLQIDHLCRNRGCVNPDHLEAVTGAVNLDRARVANGLAVQCKRGHARTAETTYRSPSGRLCCRLCKRFAQRRFVARNPRAKVGRAQGERVSTAKVTPTVVAQIRADHAEGARYAEIARRVGLTKENVSLICRRRTWKHVP